MHHEDYLATRERLCDQVVPGPLPTEEQGIPWSAAVLLVS